MTVPRPEHPRPQLVRDDWLNLNGEWRFAFDYGRSGLDQGWVEKNDYPERIAVPFCPESELSGLGRKDFVESVFYAREIAVPAGWAGKKILLHFGAVDYAATVWLDGVEAGRHQGGSSSFSLDLTALAKPGATQTLVVHALDFVRGGLQGGGKQSVQFGSAGCHYTRVTGIWQTVWLEAAHPAGLARCRVVPAFDSGAFSLIPEFFSEKAGHVFAATLFADGVEVARVVAPAANGVPVNLPVPNPRAWSPADPFLYDLALEVRDASGALLDSATSYAGLRKIHIEGGKVFLNNQPLFQRLVLDQGYYPDGLWTAPTDAALKKDIELSMAAGFNGARLHQKVFEERFHYWADRLGYLTWAEYPSWGLDYMNGEARYRFLAEWAELVVRDANHPSIVAWTPFNETCSPGESRLAQRFPTADALEAYRTFMRAVYDLTRRLDPTRPVNDTSGYLHVKTDLWTVHLYRASAAELKKALRNADGAPFVHGPDHEVPYAGQPYFNDEWGGFKYIPPKRRAEGGAGWGYHGLNLATAEELARLIGEQIDVMLADPDLAGYCYTQLTDVEQEENGVYNYDRTPKGPAELFARHFGRRPPGFAF